MESKTIRVWLWNWVQVSIPSFAFFGCQLGWAVEAGYVTPELESLGLSNSVVNYVWIAGPISGIIVQPIIGVISDAIRKQRHSPNNNNNNQSCYSPFVGKRRPFIFIGSICTAIAMILFSNYYYIQLYLILDNVYHK